MRPLKLNFRDIASHGSPRLPQVGLVTELFIRRQYFRDISTSSLLRLLESLPSLVGLNRQNWRLIHEQHRRIDDGKYSPPLSAQSEQLESRPGASYLLTQLPQGLDCLDLFEDFDVQLHGRLDVCRPRNSGIQILPSLAVTTPNLRVLAVSFLTDAIDCFGLRDYFLEGNRIHDQIPDHTTYRFEKLEYIVLTCQEHLHPDQPSRSFLEPNAVLRAAAAVAMKMPKLKMMELWSWYRYEDQQVKRREACIFCYDATVAEEIGACQITWRSNWVPDLIIWPRVLRAWESVAETNVLASHGQVVVRHQPLPGGQYLSYGAVLMHLRLENFALDPISAMQVGEESHPSQDKLLWSQ